MSEEVRNTESGWDMPSEEKNKSQASKPTTFASKADKNDRSQDERGNSSDRAPRPVRRDDDRPPRSDRFDSYRGSDRYSDRPPRRDRFDDYRGDDRRDDRSRFDSYRGDDRRDDRSRFDSYRGDDRRDDRSRYDRDYYRGDDYRRDDRYRRGDDYGKRGYNDDGFSGYSRRDRGEWDSRREDPYREKRRRTRQDEAEPNETLGVFALKYDITQRDFDDFLATKLEKFQNNYTTKLVVDRMTGRCKGYGFITFDSIESAKEAKDLLTDGEILGQQFRVAFSVGDRRQSGVPRKAETEVKNEEEN